MSEVAWYEWFPPAGTTLAEVTRVVRVLAGRSRMGWQRLTPVVAFEAWLTPGQVRWRLGLDVRLAQTLPRELGAQLPHLGIVPIPGSDRLQPTTAREVRFYSPAFPLRLDTASAVSTALAAVTGQLKPGDAAVLQWVVGPSIGRTKRPDAFTPLQALGLRAPAKEGFGEQPAWRAKVAEPLFGVRGRIGATAADPKHAAAVIHSLLRGLELASGTHARIQASAQSTRIAHQLHEVIGRQRTWPSIINAAELAALLGWPLEDVELPGQISLFSRPSATLLVKDETDDPPEERILGRSLHPADAERFLRLPVVSCLTHVHVIGPTGSGKSNEIAQWVLADARAGRSVLLIEPKGDLVADVLTRLPVERHDDVVVIEPGIGEHVVGLNPLAGERDEAERRADELLALFRELFGSAIGPRSADVLLHALITAARLSDGTLTDVPALLTNPGFRRQALAQVNDPLVLGPFWAAFDARSDADRSQVVSPIMNKLRVLISRPAIRRLLGQAAPRFSLDELLHGRRIVLVSLNKGVLGPETAQLLGALLLTQLWRAIQRLALTA